MPLRGVGAREYSWCVVCQEELPATERLTAHLQGQHDLDLIPGCPECCYFRARSGDVDKHATRVHQLSRVSKGRGQAGCRWGLVQRRDTYRDLTSSEVIDYPRSEESLTAAQASFLARVRPAQPRGRGDLPAERPRSPVAGPSGQVDQGAASVPSVSKKRRRERVPASPRRKSPRKAAHSDPVTATSPVRLAESPAPLAREEPAETPSPRKRKASTPRKRAQPPPSPAFSVPDSSSPVTTPCRDVSIDDTRVSVHLSLSGDLNPVRMEQVGVQTVSSQEYSVGETSAATERYLYIGPEGRDASTQAVPASVSTGTQTELWVRESDTLLVVPGGTTIRLG